MNMTRWVGLGLWLGIAGCGLVRGETLTNVYVGEEANNWQGWPIRRGFQTSNTNDWYLYSLILVTTNGASTGFEQLQAQVDALAGAGGPTNGTTAETVTNIANYQAKIATNGLWLEVAKKANTNGPTLYAPVIRSGGYVYGPMQIDEAGALYVGEEAYITNAGGVFQIRDVNFPGVFQFWNGMLYADGYGLTNIQYNGVPGLLVSLTWLSNNVGGAAVSALELISSTNLLREHVAATFATNTYTGMTHALGFAPATNGNYATVPQLEGATNQVLIDSTNRAKLYADGTTNALGTAAWSDTGDFLPALPIVVPFGSGILEDSSGLSMMSRMSSGDGGKLRFTTRVEFQSHFAGFHLVSDGGTWLYQDGDALALGAYGGTNVIFGPDPGVQKVGVVASGGFIGNGAWLTNIQLSLSVSNANSYVLPDGNAKFGVANITDGVFEGSGEGLYDIPAAELVGSAHYSVLATGTPSGGYVPVFKPDYTVGWHPLTNAIHIAGTGVTIVTNYANGVHSYTYSVAAAAGPSSMVTHTNKATGTDAVVMFSVPLAVGKTMVYDLTVAGVNTSTGGLGGEWAESGYVYRYDTTTIYTASIDGSQQGTTAGVQLNGGNVEFWAAGGSAPALNWSGLMSYTVNP